MTVDEILAKNEGPCGIACGWCEFCRLHVLAQELRRYKRLDRTIPRSAAPETLEECHALIRMMDVEVVGAQEDLRQERAERKLLAAENERFRAEIAPSAVDSG